MTEEDADELRTLRTRAYGAGGTPLTPAEADRLRALESVAAPRPRVHLADEPGPRGDRPAGSSAGAPVPEDGAPPAAAPDTVARGRRAPVLAVVVLAALIPLAAVGGYLGAGVLRDPGQDVAADAPLLGRGDTEATYEDRRDVVLRSVEVDGDRVRLLAAVDGTTVWWGIRGDETCLAVDVRQGGTAYGCEETAKVREDGMSLTLQFVRVPQAEQATTEVLDVTDDIVSAVSFVGNPYTGRFVVHRAD